jgi:hypothetical protein
VDEGLSTGDLTRRLQALREAGEAHLRGRPVDDLTRILGIVGRRFLDPADGLRQEALARLPEVSGISDQMAAEVLDGMALDWTAERLEALLAIEFEDPMVLDGFRDNHAGREVRALGPGLTVHFGAGNVPGVSVTSMIRSLLVKSAVFLRPGSSDGVLPVLFAQGLVEESSQVGSAVGVAHWGTEREDLTLAALAEADQVIVYGGDDTVARLRASTPPTTRFLAYHHRLSCGLIGRGALDDPGEAASVADEAARAASLFDQRGCVSPHLYFVEEGGTVSPGEWTEMLAGGMESWAERLPPGPLDPAEASAIQQARGAFELRIAAGEEARVWQGGSLSWTVLFEPELRFEPSCLGRVVRVVPVPDLSQVLAALGTVRARLQTVCLEGAGDRTGALAEGLARMGASRVTTLAEGPWPPPWWHHDGGGPLVSLVRWTDLEL